MIVNHLEKLSSAGFTEAVINLGHLGSKIPDTLGDGTKWGMKIAYSDGVDKDRYLIRTDQLENYSPS